MWQLRINFLNLILEDKDHLKRWVLLWLGYNEMGVRAMLNEEEGVNGQENIYF